jgi:thioredoxin 1
MDASPINRLPNLNLIVGIIIGVFIVVMVVMNVPKTTPGIGQIGAGEFEKKYLQSEGPVLVDFYADWCGPCQTFAPVLEEFGRENPNVKIVRVNVDENSELARQYEVRAIPCLLVFRNGQLMNRHEGTANKAYLKKLLASNT